MGPSTTTKGLARLLHGALSERQILETSFPGLTLYRFDHFTEPAACTYPLSFLWVAQGDKRVDAQSFKFSVGQGSFLITQSEVPVMSQVTRASRLTPYLAFFLRLELDVVRRVMAADKFMQPKPSVVIGPAGVGSMTAELGDCCARILRLVSKKNTHSFLYDLLMQEITFLLLRSKQGARLRQAAQTIRTLTQAEMAVDWLSQHYATPLHIESLAKHCGMGPSTLYAHFKKLTGLSPLQYQKQLRLQAARQRLSAQETDVTQTAYLVGYQSPSQFSREYKRYFGRSPALDTRSCREAAKEGQ